VYLQLSLPNRNTEIKIVLKQIYFLVFTLFITLRKVPHPPIHE